MKYITDFDLNDKVVILRCDFNVTIKDGIILSNEKIRSSLKTINFLIDNNAKIVIMSHLGKIKSIDDKKDNSLYLVYKELCKLVNVPVFFSSSTRGNVLEEKIHNLRNKEILLVENTRFEDLNDKAESNCSEKLSKYWASLGDVFINDAFGTSHRKHASNYGISKYLPNGYGFLIQEELENLKSVLNPIKPLVIVMGGAKVDDKLDLIKVLLQKCDYLLLGGGIANSFIGTKYNIGSSLTNEEKYSEIRELMFLNKEKIILPVDFKVLNDDNVFLRTFDKVQDSDVIYDIGDKSILKFKEFIESAGTVFLNGTVGMYEDERFENGTKRILEIVLNSKCKSIIGGGDAISSIEHFNYVGYDFISTGGGATLEYIANGKLLCEVEK